MLAKRFRLHKRGSYTYLYRNGRRINDRALNLYYIKASGLRAGFSVSNKLGKACRRNKIKRRLRAAFRELMPFVGGANLVWVAREGIVEMDYVQIKARMREVLLSAGIYDENKKTQSL